MTRGRNPAPGRRACGVRRAACGVLAPSLALTSILLSTPAHALDPWWDDAWQLRAPLSIEVGGQVVHDGYPGYTVFLAVPLSDWRAQGLVRADCGDLRIVHRASTSDEPIPIALLDCSATSARVAFAMRSDPTPGTRDGSYWLYAGNPDAAVEPPTRPDAVYTYDLASDPAPLATLVRKVPPTGLSAAGETALSYADGAIAYTLGDGQGVRLLLPDAGPDLELELTMDHLRCYPLNMRSGIGVRGDARDASAGLWYLRGWNRDCGGAYSFDGRVSVAGTRYGNTRPEHAVPATDHRIRLRIHGEDPAQLTIDDAAHRTRSELPTAALTGTATSLLLGQEDGRISELRLRRYTDPEPAPTVGAPTRRLLLDLSACTDTLPHELALDAETMRWLSERMTLALEIAAAATLEDPRTPRQLLRVSTSGAGGIIRLDLLPGRLLRLLLATRNGVIEMSSTRAITVDATNRIWIRYDGETVQLWLDGEQVASAPASGALRRGDGPFPGLESLAPRVQLRSMTVYGEAMKRIQLEAAPVCVVDAGAEVTVR